MSRFSELKAVGAAYRRFTNSPITRSLMITLAADAPEALVRGKKQCFVSSVIVFKGKLG